ncbi:hypothetical protein [Schleiferilactobacillus perolens]|uniref:Uncharacterized protein n=1 Tax=Schleiferilactobacillus perolens DSM 12744 TaxID=1423792 RepID=A0A0R1MV85_9LACO|nr:hypothetical protein [Schleiferilactobacillus perolens]KRL12205.1 hypothetical protein FD09_GL003075 [Schleiferilactobacillus perolens DSM 12744]
MNRKKDPDPPPATAQTWLTTCVIGGVLIGLLLGLALHDWAMGMLIGATVGSGGGLALADAAKQRKQI